MDSHKFLARSNSKGGWVATLVKSWTVIKVVDIKVVDSHKFLVISFWPGAIARVAGLPRRCALRNDGSCVEVYKYMFNLK